MILTCGGTLSPRYSGAKRALSISGALAAASSTVNSAEAADAMSAVISSLQCFSREVACHGATFVFSVCFKRAAMSA